MIHSDRSLQNGIVAHRKALHSALGVAWKGTCWKRKQSFSYHQFGGVFAVVEYRQTSALHDMELTFQCAVKPMDVDPLLWQILLIQGNDAKPLSFRKTGAFTTAMVPVLERRVVAYDIEQTAQEFRDFLSQSADILTNENAHLSDQIAAARDVSISSYAQYFTLHALTLLIEGRRDDALAEMEEADARDVSNFSGYDPDIWEREKRYDWHPFTHWARLWLERNA